MSRHHQGRRENCGKDLDMWGIATQNFVIAWGDFETMPGLTLFRGTAIVLGFVASVLGIGEWTGYLEPWTGRSGSVTEEVTAPPTDTASFDPSSDEGRLQTLLAENITCDGLKLRVMQVARDDKTDTQTSSGQPSVYLEASVQTTLGETSEPIQAIGNGRGPGREGQAFLRLTEAVKQAVADEYKQCSKG